MTTLHLTTGRARTFPTLQAAYKWLGVGIRHRKILAIITTGEE